MNKIWLSSPHIGAKESEYVREAFETNWIAPLGPNVDAFEKQVSDFLSTEHVVALSSGTAAIHLALIALGIQEGDFVLCQSFTFAASAFPINYLKATPVFIDSEPQTWNMDSVLLEQAITDLISKHKKPAAIIVVHLYGMPAKMEEILVIAKRYEIPVIEDAAEAIGSEYYKKKCGSLGTIGILSFNGNKIITTSGGGALVSQNSDIIKRVRHISAQSKESAPYYLHKEVGYNYRLSNVSAGIGRGQMEVLTNRIERRRTIFELYKEGLKIKSGIRFLQEPDGFFSNRWLTTICFDEEIYEDRINEKVMHFLGTLNIETRLLWKPLHQQPVFSQCLAYRNGVSDQLFATGLCLPSGSNLTDEQINITIDKIVESISV